ARGGKEFAVRRERRLEDDAVFDRDRLEELSRCDFPEFHFAPGTRVPAPSVAASRRHERLAVGREGEGQKDEIVPAQRGRPERLAVVQDEGGRQAVRLVAGKGRLSQAGDGMPERERQQDETEGMNSQRMHCPTSQFRKDTACPYEHCPMWIAADSRTS